MKKTTHRLKMLWARYDVAWKIQEVKGRVMEESQPEMYIIVIDDLWRTQDWEFMTLALPEDKNGSRILVTTRIMDVAKSCRSQIGDQLLEMAPLNDTDSQRFVVLVNCKKFLAVSLKKCGGLPLAIITLASVLANKSERKEEWEMVLHSIGSTLENGGDLQLQTMRNILLLSFYDLPYYLKTCLLYMSMYPKDYEIDRKQLIWRWIAEGFVTEQGGDSMEKTAECYFSELINRSMIQPIYVEYDGRARACGIHDTVHDLIISLSIQDNFVTILSGNECNSFPDKIRRLSLQSCCAGVPVMQAIVSNKSHFRSLCSFGFIRRIPQLSGFHSLRLVDLDGCESSDLENHHIRNIGSSFQLRYLRLNGSRISKLPQEIGSLQYLENLDLRGCGLLRKLPPTIVRLQKLERLFVEEGTKLPDEIGNMQNLQELSDVFSCENCVKFVEQLSKLTKLTAEHSLRSLWIYCEDPIIHALIGGSCCNFPHLKRLEIGTWPYKISQVPKGMIHLANLVDVRINIKTMAQEDIGILMGMSNLISLHIYLWDHPNERLIVNNPGFSSLKQFLFHCFGGPTVGLNLYRVNQEARGVVMDKVDPETATRDGSNTQKVTFWN
uniref:Uncharacterized protein n=1 Tax=Oryza punctata TaxID=4537 RepID=A0A0E0LZ32_ORYPU